jgi:flagellar basal body-associated protein FliL
MKRTTIIIAALSLIVIFVGAISTSDFVKGRSAENTQDANANENSLDQMINATITLNRKSEKTNQQFAESIQDDYEIPM